MIYGHDNANGGADDVLRSNNTIHTSVYIYML